MLKFRVKGRMGNQMFIYAFARTYELSHPQRTVFFDDYLDLKNFKLTSRDTILFHHLNKIRFKLSAGNPKIVSMDDCRIFYNQNELNNIDNNIIDGYFQSYKYLQPFREEVIDWFTPVKKHAQYFDSKFSKIFNRNKILTVHIRRTDYVQGGYNYDFLNAKDLSLPVSYYHNALEAAGAKSFDRIYFMSDDPQYARNTFGYLKNAFFSEENAMTDLQLMMQADACIIANSTFSWWGAWLNNKPDKKVFTPEYFLGFKAGIEFPEGITPPDWNKISVQ